jgi:hypothetical protein
MIELSQPEGLKSKIRECKRRNGLNWQVLLKQKSDKTRVWCTLLLCNWWTLSLVSAGNKVAGLLVGKIVQHTTFHIRICCRTDLFK